MDLFKKKPTMKEQLRTNDRQIDRSTRDLEREMLNLDRQEKQLVAEMKKMGKIGNQAAAKTLAKTLIQTRNQKQKLLLTKTQMNSVKAQTHTMASTQKMTEAMGNATTVMTKMNDQIKPQEVAQVMQQFERQNQLMDMKEEMIGDGIDDALGDEMDDAEAEDIMGQVLDELGIDLSSQLGNVSAGKASLKQQQQQQQQAGGGSSQEEQLASLRQRES